eukprot:4384969-Pleurochrysis_carterae.AAC.1
MMRVLRKKKDEQGELLFTKLKRWSAAISKSERRWLQVRSTPSRRSRQLHAPPPSNSCVRWGLSPIFASGSSTSKSPTCKGSSPSA